MGAPNQLSPPVEATKAADLPSEIIRISSELFPGPLEAWCEADPEVPAERFLVLTVRGHGEPADVVERRREWHRRVARALPELDIRLAITSL